MGNHQWSEMPKHSITQPTKTRERIMHLLRFRGEASARTLSEMLGLTGMAVRKHLHALEAKDLVGYRVERIPVGRPQRLYSLTAAANDYFPNAYDDLASELLSQLRERGGSPAVKQFFEARNRRTLENLTPTLKGRSTAQRARSLVDLLDREGYFPRFQKTGQRSWVIRNHNCPIRNVVAANPEACLAERDLIANVLGCRVELRASLADRAPRCEFAVDGCEPPKRG
ncbi:MAG: metalloregulator ArsR/SmtB family transcription factor [Dehalococcoidia bacterium]